MVLLSLLFGNGRYLELSKLLMLLQNDDDDDDDGDEGRNDVGDDVVNEMNGAASSDRGSGSNNTVGNMSFLSADTLTTVRTGATTRTNVSCYFILLYLSLNYPCHLLEIRTASCVD